jgi:cbb3-type cytochrome oxidase subunit 3
MLIFIGIVAWVFWPGRKREMEENARIPFEDQPDDLPGEKEKTNGDR